MDVIGIEEERLEIMTMIARTVMDESKDIKRKTLADECIFPPAAFLCKLDSGLTEEGGVAKRVTSLVCIPWDNITGESAHEFFPGLNIIAMLTKLRLGRELTAQEEKSIVVSTIGKIAKMTSSDGILMAVDSWRWTLDEEKILAAGRTVDDVTAHWGDTDELEERDKYATRVESITVTLDCKHGRVLLSTKYDADGKHAVFEETEELVQAAGDKSGEKVLGGNMFNYPEDVWDGEEDAETAPAPENSAMC